MGTCLLTAVPGASGHSTAQPALVREDQGHPTEVSGGDGSAASQLRSRAEAQGDRTDVGTGRALPARRADPALELRWRRRRPQRAKDNAEVGQPSQRYSEVLQEILKELERAVPAQGNGRGSVEKEVFGEGGRQAVPASAERTGAVQPAGIPGLPSVEGWALEPGEAQPFFGDGYQGSRVPAKEETVSASQMANRGAVSQKTLERGLQQDLEPGDSGPRACHHG
ncbi:uncharacterized protein LOC141969731 [Athene noctua]|uniref:uncharacterized protein LOC141969731 n=1 Tax=Athene noctua TaxID=126797 RepID=UPI003EBFC30F